MELWEVFNTTCPLTWERNGRFELAELELGDDVYVIQLETKRIDVKSLWKLYRYTAELSFFKPQVPGDASFSTNKSSNFAGKVYGAVVNGVLEKFTSSYDAIYFCAEKRHSTTETEFEMKDGIYKFLADRVAKHGGFFYYERSSTSRTEYIVSKIELGEPTNGFVNPRDEALKKFRANQGK